MTKPLVVLSDPEVCIDSEVLQRLSELADVRVSPGLEQDVLAREVAHAEILVFSSFSRVTRRIFEEGERLQAVIKYGVGVDNVDFAAAAEHGVPVVNCPDYGSETVAEHAFCLMIALAKKLLPVTREMADRGWMGTASEFRGADLNGKTLGLLGFGRIGKAMARLASGFAMRRIACDPTASAEEGRDLGVELVDLPTLLAQSDFLSLHCVHTPTTHHMVDAEFLRQMKRGSYLINVSRGELIVDEALVHALDEERLAGAALDVYNEEPLASDHIFRNRDKLILTPHFAWYTSEAQKRVDRQVLERVSEVLSGRTPKNVRTGKE